MSANLVFESQEGPALLARTAVLPHEVAADRTLQESPGHGDGGGRRSP